MRLIIFANINQDNISIEDFIHFEKSFAKKDNQVVKFISCGNSEMPDSWIKNHFDWAVRGPKDINSKLDNFLTVILNFANNIQKRVYLTYQPSGAKEVDYNSELSVATKVEEYLASKNLEIDNNIFIHGFGRYPLLVQNEKFTTICPGAFIDPLFGSAETYLSLDLDNNSGKITKFEFKKAGLLNHYYEMHNLHTYTLEDVTKKQK
ncbi:hypothetical protein [Mycoplasma sp. 4044]